MRIVNGRDTASEDMRPWQPGTHRLRDTWVPIAHSKKIAHQVIRRFVHGQPYYLLRDRKGYLLAQEFHPEQFRRLQKNASEFTAGSGQYPVVERYGFAWVWYGHPANANESLIPDIPFISAARGAPDYASLSNYFHCSYELVLENILDMTHIDFVHGNYGGTHESDLDTVTVESTSESITMVRTTLKRPTSEYQRNVLKVREKHQDVHFFTHVFIRSGLCILHAHFSAAPSMPLMQNNTPESRFVTRADTTFGTDSCEDAYYRRNWPKTGPMIAAQDESVLNPQNPRYLFEQQPSEASSRFDSAGFAFRKRFRALVSQQQAGDFSYQSDYAKAKDVGRVLKNLP